MPGVGGAVAPEFFHERKSLVLHDLVHHIRLEVLELGPAAGLLLVGVVKDGLVDLAAQAIGGLLLGRLQFVEATEEQEVGNLLNDAQRIGDPAAPEGIPYRVDLRTYLSRDHRAFAPDRQRCRSTKLPRRNGTRS